MSQLQRLLDSDVKPDMALDLVRTCISAQEKARRDEREAWSDQMPCRHSARS